MHAIQNLNVVKMLGRIQRTREMDKGICLTLLFMLVFMPRLCTAHALRPFPNTPEPAWNGPNGMGPAFRSVIIKLNFIISAFHVSRPSARNHLSFVDDDCRAGPAAPPSLFLPPYPQHEPRHTSTKFMQHANKKWKKMLKENPHERAHHTTTLTTTTTDERTNVTVHLSSYSPFLPPAKYIPIIPLTRVCKLGWSAGFVLFFFFFL
jgi:hypothetical protein